MKVKCDDWITPNYNDCVNCNNKDCLVKKMHLDVPENKRRKKDYVQSAANKK